MEGEAFFSRFVCTRLCWQLPVFSVKNVLFLAQEGHLSHGKSPYLLLGKKGEVRVFFQDLLLLKCLQLIRSRCQSGISCGGILWTPSPER